MQSLLIEDSGIAGTVVGGAIGGGSALAIAAFSAWIQGRRERERRGEDRAALEESRATERKNWTREQRATTYIDLVARGAWLVDWTQAIKVVYGGFGLDPPVQIPESIQTHQEAVALDARVRAYASEEIRGLAVEMERIRERVLSARASLDRIDVEQQHTPIGVTFVSSDIPKLRHELAQLCADISGVAGRVEARVRFELQGPEADSRHSDSPSG
jgi:hypothetical protein